MLFESLRCLWNLRHQRPPTGKVGDSWNSEPDTLPLHVPMTPPPTLRDYIFPARDFEDAIIPFQSILTTGMSILDQDQIDDLDLSTSNTFFEPGPRLNRLHLPTRVERVDGMIQKMRDHLMTLIDTNYQEKANAPASADVRGFFSIEIRTRCAKHQLDTEGSVKAVTFFISGPIFAMYRELTGRQLQRDGETMDRAARIDSVFKERIPTPPNALPPLQRHRTVILWDDKGVYPFRRLARSLQRKLDNGGHLAPHISRNNDQPDQPCSSWTGSEGIMCKIGRHAMNKYVQSSSHAAPRWAVIFGGEEFIAVLILYVRDGKNRIRPALYCSPTYRVDDYRLPITSVFLYMALTGEISQEDLITCYGISVHTPGDPFTGPKIPFPSPSGRRSQSATRTLTMKKRVNVFVKDPGGGYSVLTRLTSNAKLGGCLTDTQKSEISLIIDDNWIIGSTGIVYYTKPRAFIIKCSYPTEESRECIAQEATVYESVSENTSGLKIPEFYGVFQCGSLFAVILSDEGDELESFETLSETQRRTLLDDLIKLHEAGIYHYDFAPRNVVQGENGLTIIDFSFSEYGHQCRGPDECHELVNVYTT